MQLCVREWQLKDNMPVHALAPALATPRRLGLPRLGTTSPLLYISAGPQEIGLWDMENARCHQVNIAAQCSIVWPQQQSCNELQC